MFDSDRRHIQTGNEGRDGQKRRWHARKVVVCQKWNRGRCNYASCVLIATRRHRDNHPTAQPSDKQPWQTLAARSPFSTVEWFNGWEASEGSHYCHCTYSALTTVGSFIHKINQLVEHFSLMLLNPLFFHLKEMLAWAVLQSGQHTVSEFRSRNVSPLKKRQPFSFWVRLDYSHIFLSPPHTTISLSPSDWLLLCRLSYCSILFLFGRCNAKCCTRNTWWGCDSSANVCVKPSVICDASLGLKKTVKGLVCDILGKTPLLLII